MSSADDIPYGYCHCGCGQKTQPFKFGSKRDGIKNGQPRKYIQNHKRHYSAESKARMSAERRKLTNGEYVGRRATGTYSSWKEMLKRCFNPKSNCFAAYGGRGITVAARWVDSFSDFRTDMGERPEGLTLERIDNNGSYEPGNCKWATRAEQTNNQRSNIRLEWNGQTLTLTQLAKLTGMKPATLRARIVIQKLSVEDAVSRPLRSVGRWAK